MALVALGLVAALTLNLTSTPPLWHDEGWTLLVARNWIERDYYGQINGGELQSPGLSAAFPLVAAVAFSFRILGVGVWQGRLVGVMFTLGALSLLYLFAAKLYNRRIAFGTLFAALLMAPHLATNPIYMGRQVMAELPMLFFVVGGYVCLFLALRQPAWVLAVAVAWGLGLSAKAQLLPFWLASLIIPSGFLFIRKEWRLAGILAGCLVGGYYFSEGVTFFQGYLLRGHTTPGVPLDGLVEAVALTTARPARQAALSMTLLAG
ncbi:MAG: glycosyltransferase family 39 protein, partial [Anaerolineales bacterium]